MHYFETVCSLCTTYLPILRLRISVIFLLVDLTFIHILTLDFLMLVIYMLINRLRIQLNSFSIFGAKLWNCLKPELRKLRKKPFKNKVHQFLLAVLGNEDEGEAILRVCEPEPRAASRESLFASLPENPKKDIMP